MDYDFVVIVQEIDLPKESSGYPFKPPRVDPELYQVAVPSWNRDEREEDQTPQPTPKSSPDTNGALFPDDIPGCASFGLPRPSPVNRATILILRDRFAWAFGRVL